MKRRGGLGSGLDALLGADEKRPLVREVSVTEIVANPRQPRLTFDDIQLDDLAASIREHGIIQPLIVSAAPGGYALVAGERRLRAAQRAGLSSVPVIVRETTPQQLLELALIENIQRADLTPLEEAIAYQALKDSFGLSDEAIAQRLGIASRVTIANTRRLLKLPEAAQDALRAGQISAGHGRALLRIDTAAQQLAALAIFAEADLSVREAERLADLIGTAGDARQALAVLRPARVSAAAVVPPAVIQPDRRPQVQIADPQDADDAAIRRELEALIGTPVRVERREHGVRLTIDLYGDEAFAGFVERLRR